MFAERRKNIEGNLSRCRERQKQQKRDEIKIEKRQTKENMKRNLNADSGPVSKYKDNRVLNGPLGHSLCLFAHVSHFAKFAYFTAWF